MKLIEIDPIFEGLLVPLKYEENKLLELSILENGCTDPIKLWNYQGRDIIVDGHNRYRLCTQHGKDFKTEYLNFNSVEDAKYWMINNQLGRRNLTSDQLSYYRGLKYLQLKKDKGGYRQVLSKGQNELSTSELVSKEFNVSASTIKRDYKFAVGIELIGRFNGDLKNRILNGELSINKKDIQLLGDSSRSFKVIKNEADLINKIGLVKKDLLNNVEKELDAVAQESNLQVEEAFPSYEEKVKKVKGKILSYINLAIDKKDSQAIGKLKDLIETLALLIESK